jgi:hypothetical protein
MGEVVAAWSDWRVVLGIPVHASLLLVAPVSRHPVIGGGGGARSYSAGRLDFVGAAALSSLTGSLITVPRALGRPARAGHRRWGHRRGARRCAK